MILSFISGTNFFCDLIFLSLCRVLSSRCLSPVSSAELQTALGEHGRQRKERKGSASDGHPGNK